MAKMHEQCHTCKEPFRLYKPYYTIRTRRFIGGMPVGFSEEIALCPDCYRAYGDFLITQTVQKNHEKNLKEMKGAL